jgi:hypothetical protein
VINSICKNSFLFLVFIFVLSVASHNYRLSREKPPETGNNNNSGGVEEQSRSKSISSRSSYSFNHLFFITLVNITGIEQKRFDNSKKLFNDLSHEGVIPILLALQDGPRLFTELFKELTNTKNIF